MAKSAPNPEVDWYFEKDGPWAAAFAKLRAIALASGLAEELKWGHPCYGLDGKNVVLMHGFKDYCALLFHKGALMDDDQGILVQQTENVQSARQVRFTSAREVTKLAPVLKRYIAHAAEIERSGRKVEKKTAAQTTMPAELASALAASAPLKKAFAALTPGRQRAYILHVGGAKQSATRAARVEKHRARILAGKGIDD